MCQIIFLVPPKWTIEPFDQSAILGNSLKIVCKAEGFPPPKVLWKQQIGINFIDFNSFWTH